MINEHGLECPVNWNDLHLCYKWIAIDSNGEVWAYEKKPNISDTRWECFGFPLRSIGYRNPPTDFTKCLWQRPKTESKIKNKHGLMPPIPWEKTMYDWQAIQPDGSVYVYGKKPIKGIDLWFNSDSNWDLVAKVNPPKDFSKCLWKHPKIKSK